MLKSIVVSLILIALACNPSSKWVSEDESGQQAIEEPNWTPYQRMVKHYQDSMSYALISGENGVLDEEQIAGANPLSFFSPNESYRVNAEFERIIDGDTFEMKTTTDRLPLYRRFGYLKFQLDSQQLQLTLYQNLEHPDYLFCPFRDLTSGKETYGAGRYIDLQLSDTLNPVLDFNYCYNPYCAYNHRYSCPIPPAENHLPIRIEAGVKSWH